MQRTAKAAADFRRWTKNEVLMPLFDWLSTRSDSHTTIREYVEADHWQQTGAAALADRAGRGFYDRKS